MVDPIDLHDDEISSTPPAVSTNLNVTADAASCPLGLAINTIGGRWKLHILRALLLSGPQRYNVLLGTIGGISAKELTRNLRELETSGLVESLTVQGNAALGHKLKPAKRKFPSAQWRTQDVFGNTNDQSVDAPSNDWVERFYKGRWSEMNSSCEIDLGIPVTLSDGSGTQDGVIIFRMMPLARHTAIEIPATSRKMVLWV